MSRDAIRSAGVIAPEHHVWSLRAYKVYLNTPIDVNRAIDYVERNPEKEGLAAQSYEFVQPHDGWTPPKVVVANRPTPR